MADITKKTTPVVDELSIIDRLFGWDLEHIPQWANRRTHGRVMRHGSGEDTDDELQQHR